jgi:elongation factor G
MAPGVLVVEGQAPRGELEGYSARLKAMTQGRASWTMSLSHYEQAPPQIQQQLATEYQSKRKQVEEE